MPRLVGRERATESPAQPATGTEAPASAEPTASPGTPPATDAPARETTPSAPAGQQDDWRATLTPERRREIAAGMDPKELFEANPALSGHLGKLAQRQARDARKAQAAQSGDPDAALEVLREEVAETQASRTRSHWDEAVDFHLTRAPDAVKKQLASKEYGTDPTLAGLAYWRDLAEGSVKELAAAEARHQRELKAAVDKAVKEATAAFYGDEPAPDLGAGPGAGAGGFRWRNLAEGLAAYKAMPNKTYEQNMDVVDAELERLRGLHRRGAA